MIKILRGVLSTSRKYPPQYFPKFSIDKPYATNFVVFLRGIQHI